MHDPLHPARHWRIKPKAAWIAIGSGLVLFGLLLLPTITLTAIGIPMIGVGIAMVLAGMLRFLRGRSTRYLR